MARTSHSQQILFEIELFLSAGRYEDAKVLLNFIDHDATDRATRLYLLLVDATIDGPLRYQDEIDQLANLSSLTGIEKEIVRKIHLLASTPREESHRTYQPHARLRDQSFDKFASSTTRASQSRQVAQHRRQDESEPTGFNQAAEIDASKNRDARSLQVAGDQQAELPGESAFDPQEMRYRETIRYLEIRLSEKDEIIESRDAEFHATESKVDQLTAQLAELADAKDQEGGLLREELAHQSELLQVKVDAIKNREQQFAGQLHALENELGKKQSLLQKREADMEAFTVKLSELTRECADLKSEREISIRLALDELSEKATLFQTTATAIDELETRSSAVIASFERQLAEKQAIVEQRSAALAELRGQVVFLTERLADAEAVQHGDATLPHEERQQANPSIPVTPPPRHGVGAAQLQPTASSDVPSWRFQDTISDWFSPVRRTWQSTWKPIIFSKTALPVAGAVLLIIPIVYLLTGQGRTTAKSETNVAVTQTPAKQTLDTEPPVNARLPANELKPPQPTPTNRQIVRKREARPERATTYITRRAVSLREYPRYAAAAKTQIQSGARISVLESEGNWLKVETQPPGAVGYVRKEYLVVAQGPAQY